MASFDYQEMVEVAGELLEEFGNSFILKKPDCEPKYNPKTKKTEQTYKEYNGICIMKLYSDEAIGMLSNIVQSGDVQFTCQLNDISIIPKVDTDKILYSNTVYNIVRVSTSNPSGEKIIVHTLHCRKAGS